MEAILKKYWGYDAFRPLQREIIQSVLEKKNTLAILPTGGGKSICFQVPAMAMEGICLVISPLIALMKDQVENLKKKDIPALLIHSGMQRQDVVRTLKNATQDYFKFLYLSPERLETSLFREYLPALNINLVAVDEAHCISQWGYDFRPSYLRIAELTKELPGVPVLALTASATPDVQQDICDKLQFRDAYVFRQSFERKNLSYSVFKAPSKLARLTEIVSKVSGTAIVYCRSRKRTGEIANLLQLQGVSASSYHAGLDGAERSQRQKAWIGNEVRVMVCTNAFGMGIDKPDVRLVVHADMPDCLENYYQEAGRAGRDGKRAYAVLLYDDQDTAALEEMQEIRFPGFEKIKEVYRALGNFLQVPAYSGEYQSFPFRFDEFTRNFKLKSNEALYALKALEGDGWIDFNEKNFVPSTVVFTCSKEQLYDFQLAYPQHEVLLSTLLRSYGGIFDFPAFISEKLLSTLLRKSAEEIQGELQRIASMGIINYLPQQDEPQLTFRKERVAIENFNFNMVPYRKRKEAFEARAAQMIAYTAAKSCRSQFINLYFGDKDAKPCGICDHCLDTKNADLTTEEFKKHTEAVRRHLQSPLTTGELVAALKGLKKEKAWQLISYLQSEKKISLNRDGKLQWR